MTEPKKKEWEEKNKFVREKWNVNTVAAAIVCVRDKQQLEREKGKGGGE